MLASGVHQIDQTGRSPVAHCYKWKEDADRASSLQGVLLDSYDLTPGQDGLLTNVHNFQSTKQQSAPTSIPALNPTQTPALTLPAGYAAAGFDPDRLRTALRRFKTPVVALGGITAERVSQASELGFEGVAVLGAVWQAQDPVAAMEQLLAACEACGAREPQLS